MIYFDTNVLVYNTIEQDYEKALIAEESIKKALQNSEFLLSSLVLSEYIFTLSKLKVIEKCKTQIEFYSQFCSVTFKQIDVINAYKKCSNLNKCRNINDFIHLEVANRFCKKIVTFDSDFKNLEDYYDLKIEIL